MLLGRSLGPLVRISGHPREVSGAAALPRLGSAVRAPRPVLRQCLVRLRRAPPRGVVQMGAVLMAGNLAESEPLMGQAGWALEEDCSAPGSRVP